MRSFAFFATRPQKLRFEPRRVRKRIGLRVRPNRKRGTEAPRPNGLSSAHSSGWTGGAADVVGVGGAAAGASVWLRGAGGMSLTCQLGSATAALCACWVALDCLEPREREVNGLAALITLQSRLLTDTVENVADNRALVTFQGDVGANCPEFPCKRARMRE